MRETCILRAPSLMMHGFWCKNMCCKALPCSQENATTLCRPGLVHADQSPAVGQWQQARSPTRCLLSRFSHAADTHCRNTSPSQQGAPRTQLWEKYLQQGHGLYQQGSSGRSSSSSRQQVRPNHGLSLRDSPDDPVRMPHNEPGMKGPGATRSQASLSTHLPQGPEQLTEATRGQLREHANSLGQHVLLEAGRMQKADLGVPKAAEHAGAKGQHSVQQLSQQLPPPQPFCQPPCEGHSDGMRGHSRDDSISDDVSNSSCGG